MKKWLAVLCTMMLIPMLAAAEQETFSVSELRKQVKESTNDGLRALVYIPNVEKLPILSVRLQDVEKEGLGELPGYPSIERMDYEKYGLNTEKRIGTKPEIGYMDLFLQPEADDLKQIHASNQPISAEEIIEKGVLTIRSLNPQNGEEPLLSALTIQSPWKYVNQPENMGEAYDCKELTGMGGYCVSYYPVLQGIPVIGGIGLAFEESAPGSKELRRALREKSEYTYIYYLEDFWQIDGLGIWEQADMIAEDMPLCPFEKIAQTIEQNTADGTIDRIYNVILGYVVYMNSAEDYTENPRYATYTAVPTWCVSVHYKGRFREREWMMINAQTGEAYEHQAKRISDWYAPESAVSNGRGNLKN